MAENSDPVHIRELMTLLDNWKKDIIAEIDKGNVSRDKQIELIEQEMDKRFDVHELKHEREKDHRSSLMRWAVTTIISFAAIAVSAYSVMEALGG